MPCYIDFLHIIAIEWVQNKINKTLSKRSRCDCLNFITGVGVSHARRKSALSHGIRPLATGRMKVARRNTWPSATLCPSLKVAPQKCLDASYLDIWACSVRPLGTRDQTPATNQKTLESNCKKTETAPFCGNALKKMGCEIQAFDK